ncbi:hypothetical protein ABTP16_06220 [Acinetobacter baumannii]
MEHQLDIQAPYSTSAAKQHGYHHQPAVEVVRFHTKLSTQGQQLQ